MRHPRFSKSAAYFRTCFWGAEIFIEEKGDGRDYSDNAASQR